VSSLLGTQGTALKACVAGNKADVQLTVTVAGGKPTVKLTSKAAISAKLDACVKKAVASIAFTVDGIASTTIKP
jgi:hypothetical protein